MQLSYLSQWPDCRPRNVPDEASRTRIAQILSQMTVAEKIGQMIQPEMFQITPEEAGRYKFGSILNGAGLFPNGNAHASQAEWVATIGSYWSAVDGAFADRPFRIPLIWATDAVHGHNNLFGATIFPHNINLGCAFDPELIGRIGTVTAHEVAATGIDWTFAPSVSVPRDYRWGRHFEGYSESPGLVAEYAQTMVAALQGGEGISIPPNSVIACAKHWIADGGSHLGIDRGDARCSEDVLRNIHAAGYLAAVAAGVGSIMVSFSSWPNLLNYDHSPHLPGAYNGKLSGSKYLITDVLKGKMGFDGVVITDWDAHADVPRCNGSDAAFCINAGVDILMVSQRKDWIELVEKTEFQISNGLIPLARVDDAVTRVLTMKMKAGAWNKPHPSLRAVTLDSSQIGNDAHRNLAREATRKSMVLLKNNGGTLPLDRSAKILVTGSAADQLQKQTGGWTLSWQGTDIGPDDIPGALTLAQAVSRVADHQHVTIDPFMKDHNPSDFDVVLVAIGEDAYAEMRGNIRPWRSLSYANLKTTYAPDLEILRRVQQTVRDEYRRTRVVTLFFGGRPLYVNEEINLSDAFVSCWLPGPYADALCDVLFRAPDGHIAHDFTGRLAFSWPARKKDFVLNHWPKYLQDHVRLTDDDDINAEPNALFPFGFGLNYAQGVREMDAVPLDEDPPVKYIEPAREDLVVFECGSTPFDWYVCGHNIWATQKLSLSEELDNLIMHIPPVGDSGKLEITFKGFAALVYGRFRDGKPHDMRPFVARAAEVEIIVEIIEKPTGPVYLALHDDYPGQVGYDIAPQLNALAPNGGAVRVPFSDLAAIGMELENVDTPFMLYSEATAHLRITSIRFRCPAAQ